MVAVLRAAALAAILLSNGDFAGAQPATPPHFDAATQARLLEQFRVVAGAWYVEQRCNRLPASWHSELERNTAEAEAALAQLMSQPVVAQAMESAKAGVAQQACGDRQTAGALTAALGGSRALTATLAGQLYKPQTDLGSDTQRITLMIIAQKLDDRCKIMQPDQRQELDGRLSSITPSFTKTVGADDWNAVVKSADVAISRAVSDCGATPLGDFIRNVMVEARKLTPNWRP